MFGKIEELCRKFMWELGKIAGLGTGPCLERPLTGTWPRSGHSIEIVQFGKVMIVQVRYG